MLTNIIGKERIESFCKIHGLEPVYVVIYKYPIHWVALNSRCCLAYCYPWLTRAAEPTVSKKSWEGPDEEEAAMVAVEEYPYESLSFLFLILLSIPLHYISYPILCPLLTYPFHTVSF